SPRSSPFIAGVGAVVKRWGRIDVLVNNAVQWGERPPWESPLFEQVPPDEWKASLRANTEGHYAAIQAVLPSMRERKWGRIVNVSSAVAVDGLPGAGPYSAAKAALHGLTRTLAKEVGPAGVLVNIVMPGHVDGAECRAALRSREDSDSQRIAHSTHPVSRGSRAHDRAPVLGDEHGGHRGDHPRERQNYLRCCHEHPSYRGGPSRSGIGRYGCCGSGPGSGSTRRLPSGVRSRRNCTTRAFARTV